MRVITYLGFTLLSILTQFCVMDYIQEKIKTEEEHSDLNTTSQKKRFHEMLKDLKQKPHALYYRTNFNSKITELKATLSTKNYSNMSVPEMDMSTMLTSTILDEFYDENTSTTEDTFTTETFYSTTDIDNVTEITFFDKRNHSTLKPKIPKAQIRNKNCGCDLMYKVCDINCCCDSDCADSDKKLFGNCKYDPNINHESQHLCYSHEVSRRKHETPLFDNLFCIVKTNIPDKKNLNRDTYSQSAVDNSHKWHINEMSKHSTDFQRKLYIYGDTVWVLKRGSIWYIDMPAPMINNYCNSRKPILFLKEEIVKCSVRLKDLEMFHILKTSQESFCVSVTEKSLNSSALNCSTLHCTNWTVLICGEDGKECAIYNKTVHEPSCTDSYCTNLALRLDYIFHYYDSKITNVTIKFFVKTVASQIPFMTQVINVKFVMTNQSDDQIIKVSGNPGYIYSLPVISSMAESNHTINFFNSTFKGKKYLTQPSNKNGFCESFNTNSFVQFGINKRVKCRYLHTNTIIPKPNSTKACDDIQNNIIRLGGMSEKIYVSPLGNPIDIKDKDWLSIYNDLHEKEPTYGQFLEKNSRLRCYNLITRISYMFTFADVSEIHLRRDDKIVAVNISVATQNVTFSSEDASTVLTIDTSFIDGTKPKVFEYAGGPHLSLRLPKDFFFPFPSHGHRVNKLSTPLMMLCITIYVK